MIPRWADRYMGIPFVDAGASRDGCNCWGLVALVLHERAGLALDPYSEIEAGRILRTAKAMRDGRQRPEWRAVARDDARALDVVLMRGDIVLKQRVLKGIVCHVGVMVSDTHVMHIERGINSACLPVDASPLAARIVSFHRHAALDS